MSICKNEKKHPKNPKLLQNSTESHIYSILNQQTYYIQALLGLHISTNFYKNVLDSASSEVMFSRIQLSII
jgi:hypothetical protein